MTTIYNLFTAILKAVCAPASNGGEIFKRIKRGPFNPKITLGINMN